jgi:glycosyltransferase involved in cell wall biosynthesis
MRTGTLRHGQSRVLVLTPDLSTIGGVENYYRAIALPDHDSRVEYFFVTSPVPQSGIRLAARLLRNYWVFCTTLARSRIDVVVVNPSLNRNSFYRDAIFCWLALAGGRCVLAFFRGWSDSMDIAIRRQLLPRWVFRGSFARVRHFIILSDEVRNRLISLGCDVTSRFWRETTVADSAYLEGFSLADKLKRDDPLRLLFMSRLVPSKRADLALMSYLEARHLLPGMRMTLTVAGDGPEFDALRTIASQNDIPDVHFTGTAVADDRRALLWNSHVLLFPTCHGEGMPNVVLEAMLYGMPVIARPVGGIPAVVEHGLNGLLTWSTDSTAIAALIVELAKDRDLRHGMAKTNHEKALASFTSERVRERLSRLLDDLLLEV